MTQNCLNSKADFTERSGAPSVLTLSNLTKEGANPTRTIQIGDKKILVSEEMGNLPQPNRERNKMRLQSTHQADYKWPFLKSDSSSSAENENKNTHGQTSKSAAPRLCDQSDYSTAFKRCHSQFTDWDNHRRPGWNTWKDESGIYANSHLKAQLDQYQPTATLPQWND